MRKLLFRITALALSLCMLTGMAVFAEDVQNGDDLQDSVLTIDYTLDIEYNELKVFGTVVSEKGGVPLVLKVTRGSDIIAADSMFSDDVIDGTAAFEFEGIPFPSNALSGDYKIYVSADYVMAEAEAVYTYIGVDRRLELIKLINKAIDAENSEADDNEEPIDDILSIISKNSDVMSIDKEELDSLGDDVKDILSGLMLAAGVYSVPDGFVTEQEIELIDTSFKKLCANYADSLKIAYAAQIDSKEAFAAYLKKYGEEESFYADEEGTDYDEAVMAEYFDKAADNDALYPKIVSAAKNAANFDELKDLMLKEGIIALLEEGRYTDIEIIVDAIPGLFDIDTDKLGELSDETRVAVYQALASDKTFASIEDFSEEFDKLISNPPSVSSSSDDSDDRTSSRGSSSGGRGSISVDSSMVTSVPVGTSSSFSDLTDCEWAREAVEALAARNIVSGRGNGLFDPGANITRAEFVKIVVGAFGLGSGSYNGQFADVSRNDWYAPYVAAANSAGIVVGNNGYFNPLGNITREDMAVILYRAAKMSASENTRDVFYDSEQMSDYAKDAIFAMYEKGIIKGRGNGMFEPKGLASRAEAAQMIFNAVK